jgi:hypothetical protein
LVRLPNGQTVDTARLKRERCRRDPAHFLRAYCRVYNATLKDWVPFELWPAQVEFLQALHRERLLVVLKARQLGFTWVVVAYLLHQMLFEPAPTALIFSKSEDDAIDVVDQRLKGMHHRLPAWLQAPVEWGADSKHDWKLGNGSHAKAFATTGGRSYTGSFLFLDEADWMPGKNTLEALLAAAKPAIDAGGRAVILSSPDKARPQSTFKKLYRAAKAGTVNFAAVFQPWTARPDRTPAWYEEQRRASLALNGSLDLLHQEYPATDAEALSPRSLDKRIAAAWLEQCYREQAPVSGEGGSMVYQVPGPEGPVATVGPAVPGLVVYVPPQPGRSYVIGGDPAEGNPTSDDSAATVLDAQSGEEVACLAGKFEPAVFAEYLDAVGQWYNEAALMVERNNHGHAVLLWLREHSRLRRLLGHDGNEGWLSSERGKALLYSAAADGFRNAETVLHSFDTFAQLASIDGNTLRAPEGEMDDRADSHALAVAGMPQAGAPRLPLAIIL